MITQHEAATTLLAAAREAGRRVAEYQRRYREANREKGLIP